MNFHPPKNKTDPVETNVRINEEEEKEKIKLRLNICERENSQL